ncbi:MAG: capsid cement protein [Candidatus Geothermarchaeales archaeon]
MAVAGETKYHPGDIISMKATADITKGQVVKLTGSREVQPASAKDDPAIGVALKDISNGDYGDIQVLGAVYVVANGAISVGAFCVPSTTAGRVEAKKTAAEGAGAVTVETVIGQALEAASAAGDVILMLLVHFADKDTGT